MTAARKAIEERSQAATHEKKAVLKALSKQLKEKSKSSGSRRRALRRYSNALGKSDPVAALREAVVANVPAKAKQNSGSAARAAKKATSAKDVPGKSIPEPTSDEQVVSRPEVRRISIDDVQNSMQLPTASEYPDAAPTLHRALNALDGNVLSMHYRALSARQTPPIEITVGEHYDKKAGCWLHDLDFDASGPFQQHVIGTGTTKTQACSAAWLALTSLLHNSGMLAQLLPKYVTEEIQPRQEQYPNAPARLFNPESVSEEMNKVFQSKKLSPNVGGDYGPHGDGFGTFTLRLDIPNIADATAKGVASSKILAKRAAWVSMLNRLHEHGALQQLFPSIPKDGAGDSQAYIRDDKAEIELVDVDQDVLKQEKDARLDIYNYAAKYGAIPQIEVKMVRHVRRRTRLAKASRTMVAQASIRLPEHDIEVVTRGKTAQVAEIAAAMAFKRQAEEQHLSDTEEYKREVLPAYELLDTDSAKDFVEHFRTLHPGMALEVETDTVQSTSANEARILLDGEAKAEPGIMRAKKDAIAVAYLLTAIAIANSSPQILEQWAERRRNSDGSSQRMVRPIKVPIETEVLDVMRDTLIGARKAGLPDQRETLSAEEFSRENNRSRRRFFSLADRNTASTVLKDSLKQFRNDPQQETLRTTKANLPMSQYTKQVTDLVSGDVYSIVIGATGSGKTTQVPQVLLDHAIENGDGGHCDIICTQPRRLAASSVAQRVAAERDQKIGETVGYQVRGDVKLPQPGGSITYCTTGILLEQLKWNADDIMDNVSHLIIDEVHERDIFVDFLLIILKKAVQDRQRAGKKVPHIVLMSATLDEKLFSQYLPNDKDGKLVPCPSLSVPGRTFPVTEKYLVELVDDITKDHKAEFESLLLQDKGVSKDFLDAELAFAQETTFEAPIIDWKRKWKAEADPENQAAAAQKTESLVPVHLLTAALAHICNNSQEGAILAFLPGLQEITAAQDFLLQSPIFGVDFGDAAKFNILPLHSTVPPDQQKLIFEPSPAGCRKIILATNIAETSVTVPDVKYVVDTGKLREKRYDQIKRISELQTVWESNSNARQRAGRAGRVSEGNYYALYSRQRRQAMSASGQPELLRSDLQETCLSIKAQGFQEPVSDFLAHAIEPPSSEAVSIAVENLKSIEAFTSTEQLTSLGRILSRLPVHPTLGNMVLLGIVFRCLDPLIISSCQASERSLFVDPPGARTIARQRRQIYAQDGSDHLAFINAFKDLRTQMNERGMSSAFAHAQSQYLHFGAFKSMEQTTRSIAEALQEAKLISSSYPDRGNGFKLGGADLNRNSNNTALVKSLILAGVYPNIAIRRAMSKAPVHRTANEDKVMMHPSSMNAVSGKARLSETDQLYAFNTLARSVSGENLFMRDTTLITPLMIMLFGGRLEAKSYKTLTMDAWLPFSINALNNDFAVRLLLEFRKAKDRMLHGAYKDLSGRGSGLLNDPARELFANGLINMLKIVDGARREKFDWVPETFKRERQRRREMAKTEGGRFENGSDDVRNQARSEDSPSRSYS
ncbi:Putative helicase, P-loop containing nucleoside triphosphate hydrolase [Septoria linicola]|uniref:RNA helicase n=1 Tax=Septoria linicola TaxID=215465 RepID=A0A9Q9B0E7_9PEZI|nr:putative helicase, P-loop containing nucleoside triphosphate hydrolase [Septoria linicola]USW55333.1 Putative helicase, P-loop containing nucleoside triphosphate hydrolase [Septoria linicola]